jgi:hypothetical protein
VLTPLRLGTLGFVVGTAAWAFAGGIDPAVALYALGCLFLVDDAFLGRSRVLASLQKSAKLDSYRTSSLAYAAGTVAWGYESWRDAHVVDVAAVLYLAGCAFFVVDSFRPFRARLSSQQLGAIAFGAGTIAWALSAGFSIPVAAYGLGCLFFLRDAFRSSKVAAT